MSDRSIVPDAAAPSRYNKYDYDGISTKGIASNASSASGSAITSPYKQQARPNSQRYQAVEDP